MNEAAPSIPGQVLVVGTGLVGTSLGLALSATGRDVRLRDLDPGALAAAVALGAGSAEPSERAGCVVVAVPPAEIAPTVAAALAEHPEAVATDVSSVKSAPLAQIRAAVDDDAIMRYVGGHPMAGSEHSGPGAASGELFRGRAWAVTPHPTSSPDAIRTVTELVAATGARVVTLSPEEHDLAVARVSHLPHLLSVLAAARLDDAPPDHLALTGQGLRDVTRVAAGDPTMWTQILIANAAVVRGLLAGVRDDLDRLLAGLTDDPDEVDAVLRRGLDGTRRIPAKHGGPARAEAVVVVAVPDRPGELARLFADAGQSGVNVEDLRIDHDPGRPVGLVELVVRAGAAAALGDALVARGWPVQR